MRGNVYASWLNHLCDHGCGDELALKQVLVFTAYADEARIEHTTVTPPVEDASVIADPREEIVLDDVLVSQTSSKLETHESLDLPLGTYVVSVSSRSEFRRLHVTGGCPRVPGQHYANFEVLGTSEPSVHSFHARCLHCFPESKGVQEAVGEVPSAGSPSTSSESSDSVSE